jgi:hypothetical protein
MLTACEMPSMPDFLSLPDFPSLPSFSSEGPATADDVDCGTATRLDLAALDWDGAKRVDMYARASGVSPATLVMTVNTPNIIRLYNATRDVWTFRAEEFFKQAAIVRIIYGGKDVSETCIEAIRIGPLKWAEVRVVPLRQGEFYFRDEAPSRLMSLFGDEDPAPPGHIIVR